MSSLCTYLHIYSWNIIHGVFSHFSRLETIPNLAAPFPRMGHSDATVKWVVEWQGVKCCLLRPRASVSDAEGYSRFFEYIMFIYKSYCVDISWPNFSSAPFDVVSRKTLSHAVSYSSASVLAPLRSCRLVCVDQYNCIREQCASGENSRKIPL